METPSNQKSPNSGTQVNDAVGSRTGHEESIEIEHYDMGGRKYLFIFNHVEYEGNELSRRQDTDKDVEKLKEVFGNILNFTVLTYHDETYSNIVQIIEGIGSMNHKDTSCICVAILTHGSAGGYVYAKDRPYSLKEIVEKISHFASLANIPKLFFVQACRGGLEDTGHIAVSCSDGLSRATPSTLASCLARVEITAAYDADPVDGQLVSGATVPTHADVMVVSSTVEGYVSYRKKGYGSWMIQTLCNTIRDHHNNNDIHLMLTFMNRKVTRMSTHGDLKQMPEIRHTLTKVLKF